MSHHNRSDGASGEIPRRALGTTGVEVTAIGLGGYHLGLVKDESVAVRIVQEAIDGGVSFLDNAWEYHDGRSEELMGRALGDRRDRVFLMSKLCTHGRKTDVAMRQLEESLRRLRTDHLDLWQIHECVYDNDPELNYAPDGPVEALDRAKREGKVRFVGFTGHKHPGIHMRMLELGYRFDTCQMPLNCFDATFRSFEHEVLPAVNRLGIAAIGMKALGGEGQPAKAGVVTAEEAYRYAMSLPVAVTVMGMDSLDVLRQDLRIARDFMPMGEDEMRSLRKRVAGEAGDGRFELYKTTAKHEGPLGRAQHGFPPMEEQPL
jgi:uncharacterized protein